MGGGGVGLSVVPQTVAKLANGYNLWLPIIHVTLTVTLLYRAILSPLSVHPYTPSVSFRHIKYSTISFEFRGPLCYHDGLQLVFVSSFVNFRIFTRSLPVISSTTC